MKALLLGTLVVIGAIGITMAIYEKPCKKTKKAKVETRNTDAIQEHHIDALKEHFKYY